MPAENSEQSESAALERVLEQLADREAFAAAEQRVAHVAPQLQKVLAVALAEGGWFDEAHDSAVLKAATTPDEDQRLRAVRTLVAEETRVGMMVGVAVGWELAERLSRELDRG